MMAVFRKRLQLPISRQPPRENGVRVQILTLNEWGQVSHFNKTTLCRSRNSPKIVAPPRQTSHCVLSRELLAYGAM